MDRECTSEMIHAAKKNGIPDGALRKYAVWCAREVGHLIADPRAQRSLGVAWGYADGLATLDDLTAARREIHEASNPAALAAAFLDGTSSALIAFSRGIFPMPDMSNPEAVYAIDKAYDASRVALWGPDRFLDCVGAAPLLAVDAGADAAKIACKIGQIIDAGGWVD